MQAFGRPRNIRFTPNWTLQFSLILDRFLRGSRMRVYARLTKLFMYDGGYVLSTFS